MKFASLYLLLSSLTLIICSCSEINSRKLPYASKPRNFFRELPAEMKTYIELYHPGRILLWRHLDAEIYNRFTLKKQVQMTFTMPELENVADNEQELAGLLRLSWTREKPLWLFAALMEEVAFGKKPYKVLFRPLVLYLARTFRTFDDKTRDKYLNYFTSKVYSSVESYLARISAEHGHYDLIFELFFDELDELSNFVANFKDRKVIMELFRDNPQYAARYLDALLTSEMNRNPDYKRKRYGQWISECIVYSLPQNYYTKLFEGDPIVLDYMVNQLLLFTNISETEYERIHSQISDHFTTYLGNLANTPKFAVLRMMNDIRFGTFDLNDFRIINMCFDSTETETQLKTNLAKAALLANKKNLFLELYAECISTSSHGRVMDEIVRFRDLNITDAQAKNFKIIFEMIQENPYIFEYEDELFEFVMKLYAVQNMTVDDNRRISLNFVVSENFLKYDFPQVISVSSHHNNCAEYFLKEIMANMEIADEISITSFVRDLVHYHKTLSEPGTAYLVCFEILELILRLPELMKFLIANGIQMKLPTDHENIEKYLNLGNFHLTSKIISSRSFYESLCLSMLPKLKNLDHIYKMEIITGQIVDEMFLRWERSINTARDFAEGRAQFLYFEWRSVLAFWVKGPRRESITRIQNPIIREMLRLDFPAETAYLLEPVGNSESSLP